MLRGKRLYITDSTEKLPTLYPNPPMIIMLYLKHIYCTIYLQYGLYVKCMLYCMCMDTPFGLKAEEAVMQYDQLKGSY